MKALRFLLIKTFKNRIKSLLKTPSKLIPTIFVILAIVFFIVLGFIFPPDEAGDVRDSNEIILMVLSLYLTLFLTSCFRGLSSGASFFSMADVTYVFTSPLSPKRILNYGLLKQIGTSLLLGLFIIFQYAWLKQTYNIDLFLLFCILVGYSLTLVISQLSSLAIYSYTNGNVLRKRIVKFSLYGYILIIIIYVVVNALPHQDNLLDAIHLFVGPFLFFIPVAGWLSLVIYGILSMQTFFFVLGSVLTVIVLILLIVFISTYQPDFYEDVLKTTETNFSAINARKEGKTIEALPTNIRKGKIGLDKGQGAWVYFYKHLKEDKRARVLLLDMTSLILVVSTVAFSYFTKANGILPGFFFALYMGIFIGSQGRWIRELNLPYIYLLPINSFYKLIAVLLESIRKVFVIAIIQFVAMGILLQAPLFDTLAAIIGYVTFHILFMGVTVLSERLFGTINNKSLGFMLYITLLIILVIPGIVAGFIVSALVAEGLRTLVTILTMALWQLGIGVLLIFLSRDILDIAELAER